MRGAQDLQSSNPEVLAMNANERGSAAKIHDAIRAAVRARCAKALDRVRIDVDDSGRATIEGEVQDWVERQCVEEAVAGVAGVAFVDCRLIVEN
jgi:osmotically-inducible protein OsmY